MHRAKNRVMIRVIHAPNDRLTPCDLRTDIFRVDVDFATKSKKLFKHARKFDHDYKVRHVFSMLLRVG